MDGDHTEEKIQKNGKIIIVEYIKSEENRMRKASIKVGKHEVNRTSKKDNIRFKI